MDPPKKFALTVVGIYADKTDAYINPYIELQIQLGYALSDENRRNEVLTSYDTVMAASWESDHGLTMKTEYFLKNPDDLSKFEAEVRAKGLPASIDVKINQTDYDKVAGPMSGMKTAVATFAFVIIILGALALALVSFLAIRERKYEIGVLRTMGMKKKKVALGLWAEMTAITCLCFVIGMGVGAALSQPVSDMLLAGQVQAAASSINPYSSISTQLLDSVSVSIGIVTVLEIFGISILLASIAGVISVSQITKYEPIRILMERN